MSSIRNCEIPTFDESGLREIEVVDTSLAVGVRQIGCCCLYCTLNSAADPNLANTETYPNARSNVASL